MTRQEFMVGWSLLVLQPWGWRYNQAGPNGKPTADALGQLEFYFSELSWAHAEAWGKVARRYAKGDKWPSVQEVLTSLRHVNPQFVRAIGVERVPESCTCPPEVQAVLDKLMHGDAHSFPADQQGAA